MLQLLKSIIYITLLVTTACSNPPPTEHQHTECRIIKHPLGKTCIPLQPQRIIALDEEMMEILVALDLKPIAAPRPNIAASKIPKLGKKAEGIISLGNNFQPNIERIVKLNPDFIVGFSLDEEQYKKYSKIAPTVTLDYVQVGWKDALIRISEITGKTQQAQQLLNQYQQRVEKISQILNNKNKKLTVSVSRFYADGVIIEFRNKFSFPGSIIAEVQLSFPEIQKQLSTSSDYPYVQVSLERVDLLDADFLFVTLDPKSESTLKKYRNSPLWQKLNAVKNNHIHIVDSSYWIFGNILSANAILDDLEKYLLNLQT